MALLAIILATGSVASLNVSLEQAETGNTSDLFYDIERNFSGFYSDFPAGFEGRSVLGSFSFRDDSLVNPNYILEINGTEEVIENRSVQLYYASRTGNTTVPLMEHPVYTGEASNSSVRIDVSISSFRSIYPGKVYFGFTRMTVRNQQGSNTSNSSNSTLEVKKGVFNLTALNSTLMDGNFSVIPSIRRVKGSTVLKVDEVLRKDDKTPVFTSKKTPKLVVSVLEDGKVLEEGISQLGVDEKFNFSFDGGEIVYVNGIAALRTKGVSRCDEISSNEFYYIINQSNFNTGSDNESCLQVKDVNNTVIDFANTTIDGNTSGNASFAEGCAVRVSNSSGVELKDPRVQQFRRGICISNSQNTLISGRASRQNNLGIYLADNSSATITQISLKNSDSEIKAVNSSVANMSNVNFDTADITGVGRDVKLENVYNPPPDPGEAVNASQWINVTETDSSGSVEDLGFNYPPLSESNINPLYIYKFDLEDVTKSNNSTSREWAFRNLTAVKRPAKRTIMTPGEISNFSIFGVYGERVQGNGTGNTPGEGAGNNPGGTGSQGGSQAPGSGAATGGSGGGLQPEPQPEPTPIELDLSLQQDSVTVQQGGTVPVNFSVTNTGDVEAPGVFVRGFVRAGWESGRQDFEIIPQGETVTGSILIDVFQSEVTGNYTVPVQAIRQGATLDQENLEVQVLPRTKLRDVSIIEGPTFLTLESGSTKEVGFLVENSGDYRLRNLSLEARNANSCIKRIQGTHTLQKSERRNLKYEITTEPTEETCTGVFTFSSAQANDMAVNPVRIKAEAPSLVKQLTTNILPVLVLIWTLFTVYWVRRRFYER